MSAEPKDEPTPRDAARDSEPGRALVVPALPRIPAAPASRPSGAIRGGAEAIIGAIRGGAEAIIGASRGGAEAISGASRGGAEAISGGPVSTRRPVPIASESGLPELPLVDPANYAVETEIGRGGLARILRATDLRLGRPVALKILREGTRELARRFVREVAFASRLQHPCIIPVYEAGRFPDGSLFYAMRLVSGAPLGAVLRRAKSLDARLALLPHLLRVADAIAYAHDRRIIHRDLKPENILVGEHGETVVIDWGFAKNLTVDKDDPESQGSEALTRKGTIIGTPVYMAPEQSRGEEVDERVDVYALGAVLYHLLAGKLPYDEQHPVRALKLVSEGPPPPLSQRARGAPRELVAIAAKAMARSPADRYQSVRAFADDLRRWKEGELVVAHRYTWLNHVGRWFTENATVSAASISALIVMAVAFIVGMRFVLRERDRAERERGEATLALSSARASARTSEASARAAIAEALTRADDLTLLHAEAALDRDPALALAWLKRLSPSFDRWEAARAVAAEARRRGAAPRLPPPPEAGMRQWLDSATNAVVDPSGKLVILPP